MEIESYRITFKHEELRALHQVLGHTTDVEFTSKGISAEERELLREMWCVLCTLVDEE